MKTQTRYGIFETNSSSMHSLSFDNSAVATEVNNDEKRIVLGTGEYGWGYEELTTPLEKMDYLAIETEHSETKKQMLLDAIAKVYPYAKIDFDYSGYIDHQSYGEIWDELTTVDDVYKCIFGKSTIEIGNDNH